MANVLVVDDDPDLRPLMKLTLMKLGHTPTLAARGEEGLAAARTGQFDVVVLDVMMPDMDGYEVTRRLRADPNTENLPILILTARSQSADYDAAMEAGADDHLAKPFNADELNAKIAKVLKDRQSPPSTSPAASVGRVLAVLGLRGGVGVTTLAVTLAGNLLREGKRTCLVDLSPAGGHVALHLRLRPAATWADLPAALDKSTIGAYLTAHDSGLMVLAAPPMPTRKHLTGDQFQSALNALRNAFEEIVVDTAPLLDDATSLAVTAAKQTLLVFTPEVGALQTTRYTLRALASLGVTDTKVSLALNHVSAEPGLPMAAVEKAIGRLPDVVVPFDRAQAAALTQGVPLVLAQPTTPLVAALSHLTLAA
jgi:pilus assembly protein CpaE